MRIVQKHQSAGDSTSDRKDDKDSKEFESCRSALTLSPDLACDIDTVSVRANQRGGLWQEGSDQVERENLPLAIWRLQTDQQVEALLLSRADVNRQTPAEQDTPPPPTPPRWLTRSPNLQCRSCRHPTTSTSTSTNLASESPPSSSAQGPPQPSVESPHIASALPQRTPPDSQFIPI
ncbi:hypothetical protein Baya_5414 [Bagarius yarrelli]|uniref:Uncharacterized protein n=1 Tax=Bagarius yarrelli TaxID=175774 RepID=A0A556TWP5_BAGYA|nr:hypothetical protein Baya_5414 [Bagarius yarrelli]